MSLETLFGLHGKTVMVTGAAGGLGQMIATGMLDAGANVVITSRKLDKANGAAEALNAGDRVLPLALDIGDEDSVERAFDDANARFGGVDVLVANAGATWGAPTVDMTIEQWHKVLRTNLDGAFLCARRFARDRFTADRNGKLVIVSSVAGLVGIDHFETAGYSATKAGLIGLARQLAVEWAPKLTVNVLAPGFFPTRMSAGIIERFGDDFLARTPLRRFGTEADVQGAAIFLASPASDYMTGAVITLDGGWTAW